MRVNFWCGLSCSYVNIHCQRIKPLKFIVLLIILDGSQSLCSSLVPSDLFDPHQYMCTHGKCQCLGAVVQLLYSNTEPYENILKQRITDKTCGTWEIWKYGTLSFRTGLKNLQPWVTWKDLWHCCGTFWLSLFIEVILINSFVEQWYGLQVCLWSWREHFNLWGSLMRGQCFPCTDTEKSPIKKKPIYLGRDADSWTLQLVTKITCAAFQKGVTCLSLCSLPCVWL